MIGDGVAQDGPVVRGQQPWADARIARLYDSFPFEDDLPFYLELARTQGRRVLEVACGSGRVMVPLVGAGFDVVGIDASAPMLAAARARLDADALEHQSDQIARPGSAELMHADMRTFALDQRDFDLAICAVKSFAYLLERSDQQACLAAVFAHLRTGGLLAIDLMQPRPEWIAAPRGSMRDDLLQTVHDTGFTLSRVESIVSTDLARQIRVIRSIYEVIDERAIVVEKRFVEWPYRWTYRFEAEHLLERAGFEIEALYGGYRGERFTSESAAMVFVARKPIDR